MKMFWGLHTTMLYYREELLETEKSVKTHVRNLQVLMTEIFKGIERYSSQDIESGFSSCQKR